MKSRIRSFLAPVLALVCLVSLLSHAPGCSQQQQAQVQADIAKAQVAYNATTQAVSDSQAELDVINGQLAQAKATAATQPANVDELTAIAALQKLHDQVATALKSVQDNEAKAQAALTTAQNLAASLNTAQPPNVSPLSAFGPYGELAGLLITTGFGVYQFVKNKGTASQVTTLLDSTGAGSLSQAVTAATSAYSLIETLVHHTGAPTQTAAVAQAHAAIAAVTTPATAAAGTAVNVAPIDPPAPPKPA